MKNNVVDIHGLDSGSITEIVDAKNFHSLLGGEQDFYEWIEYWIQQARFIEKQDYLIIETTIGLLYWLAPEAGTTLLMMDTGEVGREVRKYYMNMDKECSQAVDKGQIKPLAGVSGDLRSLLNPLTGK